VMRSFSSVALLCLLLAAHAVLADVRTERLRADWAALQDASGDFVQRSASLSPGEASDYRAYIERLRRRLADSCAALMAAGLAVPPGIDCPQVILRTVPADIDQQTEKTRTETTSTLDAELNAGLGEFDQRLLREQERIKAKASTTGGGSTSGASGAAGDSGAAAAPTGESGSAAETADAAADRERPADTAGAGQGRKSASVPPPPPDIPDGRDDDVVARQLREAAENEPDPELRKKLWDEYRRYKQGIR